MLTGTLESLVDDQRSFFNGAVAMAQQDVQTLVNVGKSYSSSEFEKIIKTNYGTVISSYGDIVVSETGKYYSDVRDNAGIKDKLSLALPSYDNLYDLRRDASINVNTAFKTNTDYDKIMRNLMNDVTKTLNGYQHMTVNSIGFDDDSFVTSKRLPRADACGFCRIKAMEFSAYESKEAIFKLDSIVLHKSCRCVSGPTFKGMETKAYLTDKQDKFEDEYFSFVKEKGTKYFSKKDIASNLLDFRKEFGYK